MPSLQQEDWSVLIGSNLGDTEGLTEAKLERKTIIARLEAILEGLIRNKKITQPSEMLRGEIISLAIKKLVQRKRMLERK